MSRRRGRFPTPCAMPSGSAGWRCSCRCCGPSSRRANMIRPRWRRMRNASSAAEAPVIRALASHSYASSLLWIAAGIAVVFVQIEFALLREVSLLGALLIGLRPREHARHRACPRGEREEYAFQHRRRLRGDARTDEASRTRPVLQLVGAVHHVDQHDADRRPNIISDRPTPRARPTSRPAIGSASCSRSTTPSPRSRR